MITFGTSVGEELFGSGHALYSSDPLWMSLAGMLFVPNLFYLFICTRPYDWKTISKFLRIDPCVLMAWTSIFTKASQGVQFMIWYTTIGKPVWEMQGETSLLRICAGLCMLAVCAVLNWGIYNAIGSEGVYYGVYLGKKVPWVSGFPFNLGIPHPQYVGVFAFSLALLILLHTPAHCAGGMVGLNALTLVIYSLTAYMESTVQPPSDMKPE